MSVYQAIFNSRGDSYNAATEYDPEARSLERRHLMDRLDVDGGMSVVDIPAGGGYLADGLQERCPELELICLEPAEQFARGVGQRHPTVLSTLTAVPLASGSVQRVGSLAGIHHLADKSAFVAEAHRVLAPGGLFAVADVRHGSPQGAFLNDVVDRLSETGHRGMFLRDGELRGMLERAGFGEVREAVLACPWRFADRAAMARFCKLLFGLHRADEPSVQRAIEERLPVWEADGWTWMAWSLVYAVGRR